MSEMVPEGWVATKLGTLGGFSKGKGISKSETISKGIPCLRYAEIYTNYDFVIKNFKSFIEPDTIKTTKKLFKNDIIFAGSGETVEDIGKSVAFISDHEAYVGGDSIILSPFPDLDSIFLSYQLNDEIRRKQLRKLGQGSSVIHIYPSGLEDMNLVLPPLLEQKKIASILTSVDEVIETTQKQIDKLQDLKKATMNELLTKGIGHTDFKDSELGRIPKSWEVATLGAYFALTSGKSKPTRLLSSKRTKDNSIPVYGGNGVNGYTDSPLLEKPTIVIGRVGEYCGCIALTPQLSWITDNALYVKTILKPYNMQFLFNLLTFTDLSKLRSKGGQPLVSQQPIHDHVVAMPPLEEQEEIASVLSAIDVRTTIQEQKLSQTQSLKKSLMQDLLTGKVRVELN